ncbi:hypothetical protein J3R83DRAFT_11895 [Lanmaoa asiatica]|nr:hypothetical protein J3R83DRAFT_11895 [Lanmaoa asiatica]
MQPRKLYALELTVAIIGQTLLLAAGWGSLVQFLPRLPSLFLILSLTSCLRSRPRRLG